MGKIKGQKKNEKLRVENGKCAGVRPGNGTVDVSTKQVERSVIRQREMLSAIRSFADSALTITAPTEDGSFLNLGLTYKALSKAISAIRELCGKSIAEGGAK